MTPWLVLLHLFALVLEGVGVYLLFQEVCIAQTYERESSGLLKIERVLNAIGRQDWYQANFEILLTEWAADKVALVLQGRSTADYQRDALAWQAALPATHKRSLARWFQQTEETQFARRRRNLFSGVACVLVALFLEGALAILEKIHEPTETQTFIEEALPWSIVLVDSKLTFSDGEATLLYTYKGDSFDLRPDACKAKTALREMKATGVLVVGRYDQRPLTRPVRLRYSSNIGLAQHRADAIAKYLSEKNDCGDGFKTVIPLIAGPSHVGAAERLSPALGEDRTVTVYALVQHAS